MMQAAHEIAKTMGRWRRLGEVDNASGARRFLGAYDVGRAPPHIRGMDAGPERMWHISPRRNRHSIRANGLRLSDVDQRHIWVFASYEVERGQSRRLWGGDRNPDLWEVDTSGYEVLPDPHDGWGDRDLNAASRVVLQPIPPERCRLLAAV